MCGISGLITPNRNPFSGEQAKSILADMNGALRHRGPDGDGLWADPDGRCFLAHRRLAIIDTSDGGKQPYVSGDGRWWMTFNGEIYNFKEIRQRLTDAGVVLRGRTDTEVLLEGIAAFGMEWLNQLDGMYALAAFDTLTGETWLARDPFGEKPIYYMPLASRGLAFASELHALEKIPSFNGILDMSAVAEMLTFQYIGAPRTIYENVKKLPPGHWMHISSTGAVNIQRYYRFRPGNSFITGRTMSSLADELEEILTRSIERRMIADVPLGAFLSGGVDSSTVCALARRRLHVPLKTFSIGFEGAAESEHTTARLFAEHLGTEHHEAVLKSQGARFLYQIGSALDEPNGDSSCYPTYALSEFARKHVTVAISGDGGDEMFGGYGRYFATLEEDQRALRGELPGYAPGDIYYSDRIVVGNENMINELFGFVPSGFMSHLEQLRFDLNTKKPTLLGAMRRHDVENYLPGAVIPKVDRMSMQHSMEVRTPFLNMELAHFAESLPEDMLIKGRNGKLILKEIASRYLPQELVNLPKQGFALPMSDWVKNDLMEVATDLLGSDGSRVAEWIGRDRMNNYLKKQNTPGSFSVYQLWGVAVLESWLRKHPASLPEIASKQTKLRKKVDGDKTIQELFPGIFVLDPHIEENIAARASSDTADFNPFEERLIDLALRSVGKSSHSIDALDVPDLTKRLSNAECGNLSVMRGATLFIGDMELIKRLNYWSFENFRRIGIAKIVMRDQTALQRIQEFDLHSQSFKGMRRLWRRRIGLAVTSKKIAKILNGVRMKCRAGKAYMTNEITGIQSDPDREYVRDYAVFEGLRQLPPLVVSHAQIESQGNGIYSIYGGEVIFSPTAKGRRSFGYWIVPLNDYTRKYLPIEAIPYLPNTIKNEVSLAPEQPLLENAVREHIVICTKNLSPGGAERQWTYLAQGLKDAGYNVSVLVIDALNEKTGHYLSDLLSKDIPVHSVADIDIFECTTQLGGVDRADEKIANTGYGNPILLARTIARLRSVSPTAIISQLDGPNLVFGFAAVILGVEQVVLSFRNYNPTHFSYLNLEGCQQGYRRLLEYPSVKLAANFSGAARDYEDWLSIERRSVEVIPNSINSDLFKPISDSRRGEVRETLGLEPNTPMILGVFRLSEEKRPKDFIMTVKKVREAIPGVRAFIAGEGRETRSIELFIDTQNATSYITVLGRRKNVTDLMGAADVLLLTSEFEGMPNVVLEAQACALPTVGTNAGATSQMVKSGKSGFVCPVGDIDGLAEGCVNVLSNPSLRKAMGEEARARVLEENSIQTMTERYVELLGRKDKVVTLLPLPERSMPNSASQLPNVSTAPSGSFGSAKPIVPQ